MPNYKGHSRDCTIYALLINGRPEDGICTCGYGRKMMREGNWDHMYSEERKKLTNHVIEYFKELEKE